MTWRPRSLVSRQSQTIFMVLFVILDYFQVHSAWSRSSFRCVHAWCACFGSLVQNFLRTLSMCSLFYNIRCMSVSRCSLRSSLFFRFVNCEYDIVYFLRELRAQCDIASQFQVILHFWSASDGLLL